MKIQVRKYSREEDYWHIRNFLRDVFLVNGCRELSWHVARLDYWRWHGLANNQTHAALEDIVFIWETNESQMVAILNPEEQGSAHLHVHPNFRTTALEDEMYAYAEEYLSKEVKGQKHLSTWADSCDPLRQEILSARGYSRGKWAETQWRRDLESPIPGVSIKDGYMIRALGGVEELPARSWASWRGFHPEEPDDSYDGWEWYLNIQRCPLYRRDLDLVAVAADGTIASFCTIWYDDVTRSAYYEPVATVPGHLRCGLARGLIVEGLHRVKKLGATRVFVGGYEPIPNALYGSVMSSAKDISEQWVKVFA